MANNSFKTGDTVKYIADAYDGRKETKAVILRPLKSTEYEGSDIGKMYKISFIEDGLTADVFESDIKYLTKKYLYIKILDRKLTGSQLFDTFEEAKKEMADDYYRLLDNSSSGEYALEEKEAWINDVNNDKNWDGYIREVLT